MDMIKTYSSLRQEKNTQYIVTYLIMEMHLVEERRPGTWVPNRWRNRGGVDYEGAREAKRVVELAETEAEEAGKDREDNGHKK